MNPEELAAMMGQGQQPPEEEMQPENMMMDEEGEEPDDSLMGMQAEGYEDSEIDPSMIEGMTQEPGVSETVTIMINEYIEYASAIIQDGTLAKPVQAGILLQMAQAVSSLVPLVSDDKQADLEMQQAELQMKQQEHEMNLEMKQAEMQMKAQEMEMKMQYSQQENQMKLQQAEENHQSKIVQSQESHETKLQQQKQAAQSKPTSKQSNKGAK